MTAAMVAMLVVVSLLATACGEDEPPRAAAAAEDSVVEETRPQEPPRAYERVLAFTTLEGGFPTGPEAPTGTPGSGDDDAGDREPAGAGVVPPAGGGSAGGAGTGGGQGPAPSDTVLVVPLFFTTRTVEQGIEREIRGWVGRGESWESFAEGPWRASPSRTPWRIVPRGPVRLVVGRGGALETVVFRDPPRVMELDLGEELVEWTGADGSTFRLESASALVGTRSFEGMALDLTRGRDLSAPPFGDWAFLVSGDSLQVVLESPTEAAPGTDGAFRAFGRIDFRRLQWREVTVEWTESRAYEPARRDVPGGWSFSSTEDGGPGPGLTGNLSSRSARLASGGGEGPVLPVDALFVVSGTVALGDSEYPVHGLYRHHRE